MDYTNITIRRKTRFLSQSDCDAEKDITTNSSLLETSTNSLPSISGQKNFLLEEYKLKIETLTRNLGSADQEIESMILENNELKRTVEKLKKTVNMFKEIGIGESFDKISTPVIRKIRKVISHNSPQKTHDDLRLQVTVSTQTEVELENLGKLPKFETDNMKKLRKRTKKQLQRTKKLINNIFNLKRKNEKLISELQEYHLIVKNKQDTNKVFEELNYSSLGDDTIIGKDNTKENKIVHQPSSKKEESRKEPSEDKRQEKDQNVIEREVIDIPKHTQENTENIINSNNGGYTWKENEEQNTRLTSTGNSKVYVLADQQGKGVRQSLQKLLGSKFSVFSYCKPGAKLVNIIDSYKTELSLLTSRDYVILLGCMNDDNPFDIQCTLLLWLSLLSNTNVIICETPLNKHLNEGKLSHTIKLICGKFKNVTYLDLDFKRFIPKRYNFASFLCRHILREILHISYKLSHDNYVKNIENLDSNTAKGTQTGPMEVSSEDLYVNPLEDTVSSEIKERLFRVQ